MAYTTRHSLLRGIHDNSSQAWVQFCDFYTPLITMCGRDCGLTWEEIKDLRQDVLLEVFKVKLVDKYQAEKGLFRNYLREVIRRKAYAVYRKRQNTNNMAGLSENVAVEMVDRWEDEWHAFIVNLAMDELKDKMSDVYFMAFDMYVHNNMPPQQVANILKITINQVYIARTRGVQLMQEIIAKLERDDTI